MYHLQINCKIYNNIYILNKHRLKNNKSCDYHVARSLIDVALIEPHARVTDQQEECKLLYTAEKQYKDDAEIFKK